MAECACRFCEFESQRRAGEAILSELTDYIDKKAADPAMPRDWTLRIGADRFLELCRQVSLRVGSPDSRGGTRLEARDMGLVAYCRHGGRVDITTA